MTYPQQPGMYDPHAPGYVDPVTGQPAYTGYEQGYAQPGYEQGYAQPGYAQPGYPPAGYPGYVAAPPSKPTNGMAIAALVLGISGIATCGVSGIVGAILGHVARRQIRENHQEGDGMALGGIISGWVTFGLAVLGVAAYVIFIVFIVSTAATYDPSPYSTY